MAKDPAALFYTDNWYLGTVGMKANERAYYLDLILVQFDKGDLPSDIEELAVICRVRHSEFESFKQVFEQVLKHKFKVNENGRLENEFASEIIRKREVFKAKRSDAGKLSYILKYFKANFKMNSKLEQFIKANISLDFDIKNEQLLEQVFKQISELYINGDGNGDINNKDLWREDFEVYKSELKKAYYAIIADQSFIITQERYHPGVDIKLSIEKSVVNFWSKEAGWKNKKKSKSKEIDWKATLTNAIDLNKVYKPKGYDSMNLHPAKQLEKLPK